MAEKKLRPGQKVKMVSVDELLGVSGEETSLELDISRIQPFQNYPFKVVGAVKISADISAIERWVSAACAVAKWNMGVLTFENNSIL